MPWGFAAVAGAGIISSAIGAGAAGSAADAQVASTNTSVAAQKDIFDTTRKDLAPFISGGKDAQKLLYQLFGITPGTPGTADVTNPDGTVTKGTAGTDPSIDLANSKLFQRPHQFAGPAPLTLGSYIPPNLASPGAYQTPSPFSFNQNDLSQTPGYQFQLKQGLDAVQNQASRSGGVMGGDTLAEMQRYAQGLAGTTYQNQFSNALDAYKTNAATSLAGYNTNAKIPLDYYLGTTGANQASFNSSTNAALGVYGMNYDTGMNTFKTNYGVDQNYNKDIYSMITSLITGGANAASGQGTIGATTGAGIGDSLIAGGNARAAGTIGSANAIGGGINGIGNAFLMSQLFGGRGGFGGGDSYAADNPYG